MKVILRDTVESLGKRGETVDVARGYARNYLIPRKLAVEATTGNERMYAEEEKLRDVRENKIRRQAERLAEKLRKVSVTAPAQVGEDDRLFGSVTSHDIENLLRSQGYEIDRRKILLEEPLKALGVYTVPIKLHRDVECAIKVWVVKK
ncbi:MAG: 50S ribosomal protein L9 [Candidatus Latescibacterota bacterium]|nr:MAG: 50S ribosomal protein L9 [Candidatus Latescibacterota bacterium]